MITVHPHPSKSDRVIVTCTSSAAAWSVMRQCDAAGLLAGMPGLLTHTVEVLGDVEQVASVVGL